MSSSRSLASARNKRAGGNPNEPIQAQPPTPPTSVGQPNGQPSGKISITDAFAKIGERLNNLELFAETTTGVINDIQEFHSNTTEKFIVDKEVFTSIVGRIETLERVNTEKLSSDISSGSSGSSSSISNDIEELKSHLIRLQTYVMETNAKLQDMVFHKNGSSLINFTDVFSDIHPPPNLMHKVEETQNNEETNYDNNEQTHNNDKVEYYDNDNNDRESESEIIENVE